MCASMHQSQLFSQKQEKEEREETRENRLESLKKEQEALRRQ
jgi:hypothetical protein